MTLRVSILDSAEQRSSFYKMRDDAANDKKRYFDRLSSYERWYARSSGRWTATLFACRTAAFVSTIGAALLTALIAKEQFETFRIPIVLLAALGTASSTFLAEFRVTRMLTLREAGRIEAAHLVNYAHDKLQQFAEDPAQTGKVKDEVRDRITALETQQGRGYADVISTKTDEDPSGSSKTG